MLYKYEDLLDALGLWNSARVLVESAHGIIPPEGYTAFMYHTNETDDGIDAEFFVIDNIHMGHGTFRCNKHKLDETVCKLDIHSRQDVSRRTIEFYDYGQVRDLLSDLTYAYKEATLKIEFHDKREAIVLNSARFGLPVPAFLEQAKKIAL